MVRWVIKEVKEQLGVHLVRQVVLGALLVAPVAGPQSQALGALEDPVVCLLDHTHHQVQDTQDNQVIGHQVRQEWDPVVHQEVLQVDQVSECRMDTHRAHLRGRIHRDILLKGDSMVVGILHQTSLKVTQVVHQLLQPQVTKDMGPLLHHRHQQDILVILPAVPSSLVVQVHQGPRDLHHKQGVQVGHKGGNSQIVSSQGLVQRVLPQVVLRPLPTPVPQLQQ